MVDETDENAVVEREMTLNPVAFLLLRYPDWSRVERTSGQMR